MEQPIPSPPPRARRATVSEYRRLEEAADFRSEYRGGQIVAMAGGSFDHGAIAANLIGELRNRLKGRGCTVVGSDVAVRVDATSSYSYPDVSVVCGPPAFDPPGRRRVLTNPQVVVEVLSPSTAGLDRGDKFLDYIRLDSLQEYVLVDQARPRVNTFYRHPDGIWAVGPSAEGMDAAVTFRSLGVSVPLAEVYAGVTFPPLRPRTGPPDDGGDDDGDGDDDDAES